MVNTQVVAITLLVICFFGPQCKVVCFLHPGAPLDERYLGFTYEATDFTPAKEYDYIIVGGGTAGCPLATTLSENYSVLLLERGGVPSSDPNVLYETNILGNLLGAKDKGTPAQPFTSEEGIPNVRGNVLGGSSMINFGFYSRADSYFYKESGIKWDTGIVEKAYEWIEDSIVSIPGLNSWQNSTYEALVESGVRPANGFTVDHLEGTKISGSTFDGSGRRHGAVELLNQADPENLRVVVHATVDRIIFSSSKLFGVMAVGVVYHDSNGRSHEVHIKRNGEVILSAGAIGSPQLLLVSGVGPESYLLSQNIPLVHHQPSVGEFMADNPRTQISLLVPFPSADIGARVVGITKEGPFIESVSGVAPFSSPASTILFPYPYAQLNLSIITIAAKFSRLVSAGSLRLKSTSDVTITPNVSFNYYSSSKDLQQCANALNEFDKMLRTQAMEPYMFSDRNGGKYFQFIGFPLPENPSNAESVEAFCRNTLRTFWHFHGGCLVNKVVDGELKVIGINALRVLDGSVFSDSPGTNPQATLLMLGRYIGMKIQNARG
ncbi:hypothetical protein OSB04_014909 [Centaurea solstitialis]|uniref:Glucose-methanol-choline oxidoreductase N-terminal domain-containing protein n=1 Tax=Centaurea solstitialis TaxID=347529 RepID=A0AA38WI73_9ASTR|nr:hypothetical protein OSB04_014909 [Centaurea solstitialis]